MCSIVCGLFKLCAVLMSGTSSVMPDLKPMAVTGNTVYSNKVYCSEDGPHQTPAADAQSKQSMFDRLS